MEKGQITIEKVVAVLIVVSVLVIFLSLLFRVNLLAYFKNLPQAEFDEEDRLVDVSEDQEEDQTGRSSVLLGGLSLDKRKNSYLERFYFDVYGLETDIFRDDDKIRVATRAHLYIVGEVGEDGVISLDSYYTSTIGYNELIDLDATLPSIKDFRELRGAQIVSNQVRKYDE